jgi:hypothetical protein
MGMTLIGWACAFGALRSLKWINGGSWMVEHSNKFRWNYTDLAARNNRSDVAAYLKGLGAKPHGVSLLTAMENYGIPFKNQPR